MLVDTHAHLNLTEYQNDLDQVIARAKKNGVEKIICVSSNLTDSKKSIDLAQEYPGIIYAAIGLHPHKTFPFSNLPRRQAGLDHQDEMAELEKLASTEREKIVAIGECGLDYSPAPPNEKDRPKKEQLFLFQRQIKLAQKLKLPILIHSRDAFDDTIQTISHSPLAINHHPGIWHFYSAGKKGIEPTLESGLYFGLDGNLTYDEGLQNVVQKIPLERIVLETDSPWLAPEPKRGSRNEPANVKIIAECLAKIKEVSFEKVSQITTENAQKIFKI